MAIDLARLQVASGHSPRLDRRDPADRLGLTGKVEAREQRDASLVWSKVAPESDLLRSACRFQQFLGRMNFPQEENS